MTSIYLSHPKHGVKIATMEMEAQYDEMHGWTRFDPDAPLLPDDTVEANVLAEPRRRGRPRVTQDE